MLIASYNRPGMGDVLVTMVNNGSGEQTVTTKQNVTEIKDAQGQLLGYNFQNASQLLPDLEGHRGQVVLTEDQVATLNQAIQEAGFATPLVADLSPKFVVGYVSEMEDHPKSDHLHITKVDLGDETVQIVCGSPNIENHVKVIVAKVGAMMPSGQIIWPGELVGVESDGMICAGRELNLKNAPDKPGCVILPADFGQLGDAFDFEKGNQLF